jgi:hypothetical protein
MKFITYALSFLRPVRFLFAALMCAMLFVMSAVPAQAANTAQSRPTDGTVQLDKIMEQTEDVAHSSPMSLKEAGKRSSEGLNEVQGAADKDKFKSSDSELPIVKDFEKAVDKATNK